MRLAEESSFSENLSDVFWRTQFGLDWDSFPLELWSRDQKLLGSNQSLFQSAKDIPLYFEDFWVGSLKTSSEFFESLSANKDAQERASSFLFWNEAPLKSKLQLIAILEQIQQLQPSFNWVGLYRIDPLNSSELLVSCFLGSATPHRRIPINSGICGAAIREQSTLNIADVSKDNRYLSCSLETKSELVVPIRNSQNEVVAELDIDCREIDGFSGSLEKQIHRLCERIEKIPDLF